MAQQYLRHRFRWLLLPVALILLVFYNLHTSPDYLITSQVIRTPISITATDLSQGITHKPRDNGKRVKATFLTICSNDDLFDILETIGDIETRFNCRYHYDWVFLNEQSFSTEFKELTSGVISGQTYYGVIGRDEWKFPENIDAERSLAARVKLMEDKVPFGYSIPYRHKTRYWLRFFANHELLQNYDYYWRVEPKAKFTCDITYDVFRFMQVEKKKYGFLNGVREDMNTMPTIWNTTTDFIESYNNSGIMPKNNMVKFLTSNQLGEMFSTCSFWSNFEIGDLNFFRSKPYQIFAEYFDNSGGIYYERWGDSSLRSIGVSLLLSSKDLHFFTDIGYEFIDLVMCPTEPDVRLQNRCSCNQKKSIMWSPKFCMHKYFILNNLERPEGWRDAMNRL